MKMKTIAATLIAALTLGACASKDKTEVVNETATETKTTELAQKRGDHVVSKVTFDKGQADLTSSAQSELTNAITEAQKRGQIENVTVAVWSDMAYPGKNRKLPPAQVKLADNRGKKIENYLSDQLDVSGFRVDVHNMGKKPGFMSSYLKTADNELKEQLSVQGMAPREGEAQIPDASSTALVFIKLKK